MTTAFSYNNNTNLKYGDENTWIDSFLMKNEIFIKVFVMDMELYHQ